MKKTFAAILRGINVSGQKKVNMAELRQLLSNKGLDNLQTYIQSGNIVFTSEIGVEHLEEIVQSCILNHFGFEVPTLIIPASKLDLIITENPLHNIDTNKLHVTFLTQLPDRQLVDALPFSANSNEEYKIVGDVIYVYCPDGYGRTKINNMFFERKLKSIATTRNWKTCLKLREMAYQKPND